MHIAKLRLSNWKCFKGETELELGPQVYAIVARLQNDPESSNWLGKSSLVEAIRFALTGYLPEHIRLEDDWITRGERAGAVEVIFSTGERILRSRHIGHGTKVYWGTDAMQAEAEKKIFEATRLTDEDFINTCYFEQKQLNRIVTEKPGERLRIVTSWMQLEPLQRMHARVAAQLGKVEKDIQLARGSQQQCRTNVDEVVQRLSVPAGAVLVPGEQGEVTWFQAKLEELEAQIAATEDRANQVEGSLMSLEAFRDLELQATRYEQVTDALAPLKERATLETKRSLQDALEERRQLVAQASEEKGILQREVTQRRQVLAHGFRNAAVCPVMCETCPVPEYVNERVQNNVLLQQGAEMKLRTAEAEYEVAARNQSLVNDQLLTFEREYTQLREKELEAARLRPTYEQWQQAMRAQPHLLDADAARAEMQELRTSLTFLREQYALVKACGENVEKSADALWEWGDRVEQLEDKASSLREALVLLGPTGAQRRIAEGSLAKIEQGANTLLGSSHIPLSVRMEWSREGGDIAKTCAQCGAPFPKSAKVKLCAKCGAARGQNIINKLEVALSNWSGAATDLGGAAIQLSASAWLRRKRGSPWSVAVLDEPFGSLDTAKRRAFAAHLASMLAGEYGFAQSFIIAHHAAVLDALPGRIEITSDGTHSIARAA